MSRITLLYVILYQISLVIADSGSGSGEFTLPPTRSPVTYPPPPTRRKTSKQDPILAITIIGSVLAFIFIVVPVVRVKNLCFIGSLCNLFSPIKSMCIECDDCRSYDKPCMDDTCRNNMDPHADCLTKCINLSCNFILKWSCMITCFIINIFRCPYSESYLIQRDGKAHIDHVKYKTEYNEIGKMLQSHDNKTNVITEQPQMEDIVYVQPTRIQIED